MIVATWTSSHYSPAKVESRYVRCEAPGIFKWCEVGAFPRFDLRQGTVTPDEIPADIREKAEALTGHAFGYVLWPFPTGDSA